MITIRSSSSVSEPALIAFEATVTTPRGVYEFSSDGPVVDSTSPLGGGLFGAMSWPHSCFRLAPDLVLEQQMFLPHDCFDVAISWELRGQLIPVRLVVRPYFSACSPRTYRDFGFRFELEEQGGRLAWLPNVRGPKIIADTNGRYSDEPLRSSENIASVFAESEGVIAPGTFEFQLSDHPSVLVFLADAVGKMQRAQHVGRFLASLMPNGRSARTASIEDEDAREAGGYLVKAA